MSKKPILEICNLRTATYNTKSEKEILHGITFSLYPCEVLAIVGESGCGKSMILQSILDLPIVGVKRTSGKVFYEGMEISDANWNINKIRGTGIGMIFQDPLRSLDPTMTVGKQLGITIQSHYDVSKKQAQQLAVNALEKVGFKFPNSILRRYPHTLSGGQCQRIMIAMALVLSPRILLADEPTTSLDVVSQHEILLLLKRLKIEHEIAILFVSHDLRIVSELSDRIAVMYQGMIVECGNVSQVLTTPSHPYTRRLLNSIPSDLIQPKTFFPIDDKTTGREVTNSGCPYAFACPSTIDVCHKHSPPFNYVERDHLVLCWLYGNEVQDER